MLEAITYQQMLQAIKNSKIQEDIIGILMTRPDLKVGKSILDSINYYHHATGNNLNFYLPGYGAYWYGQYSDGKEVCQIDGVTWSYSDKMFVEFINDLQKYSTWIYSGESELLLIEYREGRLYYDEMIRFYLENMMRDNVIFSIPAFFHQLFRICKKNDKLEQVSNTLGREQLIKVTKTTILDNVPSMLKNVCAQEKYFCVGNYEKG